MQVRPKPDHLLGWAYRPDPDTVSSLVRGRKKLKDAEFVEGAEKPHYGGNLAAELAKERRQIAKRKPKRRRRMARKVSLKELAARKHSSKKRTVEEKPSKKAVGNGKMIPLKTICAELDLDPKATRVKLRRLIDKGEINFHDHSSRWEFDKKQAAVIRAALS
jgi:hypothetical protein